MSIFIYNSLSHKKEEFIPLNPPKVNFYSCGVTVYDDCHIGHARSLYIFEVIRRYLEYRGFKVRFVRNITDIDDKIINRANELKRDWKELVKKYIDSYYEDITALNIPKADSEPRATENIDEMVKHIQMLIDRNFAYVTETGVYFSVRKFKDYGKLSGQSIEQMLSGVRKETDETKADPLDFALWKKSKPGEPSWPGGPYGEGRPGWHIECSVMSSKYLKTDTLDIHAGGRDLIFPHHENEIAQSEALRGKTFAKYWLHHGLLTINGQKMAKSLGNFVTIKDFMNKYKDADILKLFFLSAHYSQPIDYNDKKIEEARESLERINIFLLKVRDGKFYGQNCVQRNIIEIEEIKKDFIRAMDDDFNTPRALASIFNLVKLANKNINDFVFIKNTEWLLEELSAVLGISLMKMSIISFTEEIKGLIAKREIARKEKNFKLADDIRKELEEKGIILEDTKEGTTWRMRI
jgi:cysteinyl-tRNA synthetase